MSVVLGRTLEDTVRYYSTSSDRNVAKTVELSDYVFLDIHKDGSLLGLESMDDSSLEEFLASQGFKKDDIDENVEDYLESIVAYI